MASKSASQSVPATRDIRGLSTGGREAFTARDFLIAAFYHRRIIILAALVPIILGVAAAYLSRKEFTADSLLMVLVNREYSGSQNLTDSGPAVLSIEGLKSVQSEVSIIESGEIIRKTIEKVGFDRLFPEYMTERLYGFLPPEAEDRSIERGIEIFRRRMKAQVQSDSNIVRVTFQHPDREMAIETLATLMASYLEKRRQIFDNPSAIYLDAEVSRLRKALAEAEEEIQKIKIDADVIDIEQDRLLAANQVDSIQQRRRQVGERRAGVRAQVAEAEQQLAALPRTVADFRQSSDQVVNDDGNNLLTRLLVERDRMAAQYAPTYPGLVELDRKIETARRALKAATPRISFTNRDVRNPAVSYVTNMILSLKIEADALDQQLKELDRQQEIAEKRVAVLRVADGKLTDLHRKRDILNDALREYVKRAEAAKIEENAAKLRAANVRVVQDADAPGTGRSLKIPFVLAGLFAGLLFGGAAGSLGALMRHVYILPREAERSLQLPLLAEVSGVPSRENRDGTRFAALQLASLFQEAVIDGRPLRTVQFLSVGRDEGTAALVWAVAEELSQDRGLRTLVIELGDAGSRSAANSAVASPRGVTAPEMPIVSVGTPQLWRAADGARTPFASLRTRLVDMERLADGLGQHFDMVLFAGPVPGISHVAQRVAAAVDANILVVRAEVTRVPAAQRLRDQILDAGGGILGLVFTGRRYYLPKWAYRWS
ncbi:MAG: GumC family protein [Alphaproteobacteria bacterium]